MSHKIIISTLLRIILMIFYLQLTLSPIILIGLIRNFNYLYYGLSSILLKFSSVFFFCRFSLFLHFDGIHFPPHAFKLVYNGTLTINLINFISYYDNP